jgi:hypothetical protein
VLEGVGGFKKTFTKAFAGIFSTSLSNFAVDRERIFHVLEVYDFLEPAYKKVPQIVDRL